MQNYNTYCMILFVLGEWLTRDKLPPSPHTPPHPQSKNIKLLTSCKVCACSIYSKILDVCHKVFKGSWENLAS